MLLANRKTLLIKQIDIENEIRGTLRVFGLKLCGRISKASFEELRRRAGGVERIGSCSVLFVLAQHMTAGRSPDPRIARRFSASAHLRESGSGSPTTTGLW